MLIKALYSILVSSICFMVTPVSLALEQGEAGKLKGEISQQPNFNQEEIITPEEAKPLPPSDTEEKSNLEDSKNETNICPEFGQLETEVFVDKIEVIGSTVFDQKELDSIVSVAQGRLVTISELENVANQITNLYVNQDYINSRACLIQPGISDGIAQIQVIEGRIKDIQVEPLQEGENVDRIADYVKKRMWLADSQPLQATKIEEQLRLLQADPLIKNIKASLRPTREPGQSSLIVQVEEANTFGFRVGVDNYSPPIIGSERAWGELAIRNPTSFGDTFFATYYNTTTDESRILDLRYNLPVNAMNGTIQLRTFLSRSEFNTNQTVAIINEGEITQENFDLKLNSDYDIYTINFRQPIIRSLTEELAVSFGFTYRDGFPIEVLQATDLPQVIQDFVEEVGLETGLQQLGLLSSDLNQDRTSVFQVGVDYISRDIDGVWALGSQFNVGVGIFDATIRDNLPDGRFFSWQFQAQRLQRLGEDNLLIMVANLQLSPDSLLPSQQFVIGGAQSVRGFRQNVRFGDNGIRFSIEDRITLARDGDRAVFQLAPFGDIGYVWNHSSNPVPQPSQTFLAGIGIGLIATPVDNLNIRLDFALPLVNLDDRGNNLQDDGIYFNVNWGI